MESSMPGVQAVMTMSVPALAAEVGAACTPCGIAAVLLPGTGISQPARLHAVVDASKPLPTRAQARTARQDTPQQRNPQKFAYKNRIAATSGAAAGPHPAWDPV